MNNGKICVSVCAKTADDLIEQIKRAEDLADVIEIRFDCLEENEFDLALQKVNELNCSKPFLATFRPKSGDAEFKFTYVIYENDEERERVGKALDFRINGWKKISRLRNVELVDFETDIGIDFCFANWGHSLGDKTDCVFSIKTDKKLKEKTVIFSEHNYIETPENLDSIYQTLLLTEEEDGIQTDVIKIATQANDITDSIPIWQLLKRAKSENKELIPIAMGESGKWTRILGLAHGAFMTYASLDSDKKTAPGQVTAKDLHEIYRAKELDENTEVYGILGSNTSVSMSPYIHNTAFKFHKLNSVFVPLQTHDLDEFMRRMVKAQTREIELNFKGFSVTMPHKQTIIKHLDFLDETAEKIGAVNTVKIIDGKLYGYNTDAKGFIEPLKKVYGDLKDTKVAVLGAGGASRACVYALQKEGAEVDIFGREEINQIKNQKLKIENFDIVVNATPLGMRGKFEGESPLSAEQMKGVNLVYDLVYIPQKTEFLKQAESVETKTLGGLEMLLAQAVEQQRIWTDLDAPIDEIRQIVLEKLG